MLNLGLHFTRSHLSTDTHVGNMSLLHASHQIHSGLYISVYADCLASSDLLHTHLALAGTRFYYYYYCYCYGPGKSSTSSLGQPLLEQGSGHIPVRGLTQASGHPQTHSQGQSQGVSSAFHSGQGLGQAGVISTHPAFSGLQQGVGSGLTPHPNPASPLLSELSPLGASRLLAGPSGLDNLFNEEV